MTRNSFGLMLLSSMCIAACVGSIGDEETASSATVVPSRDTSEVEGVVVQADAGTESIAPSPGGSSEEPSQELSEDSNGSAALRAPSARADWGGTPFSVAAVVADLPAELPEREDLQTSPGESNRYTIEGVDWRAAFSATDRSWPPLIEAASADARDELVLDAFCSVMGCGEDPPGGTDLTINRPAGLYSTLGRATEFETEFGFAMEGISAAASGYSDRTSIDLLVGVELGSPFVPAGPIFTLGVGEDYAIISEELSEWREYGEPIRAADRDGVVGLSRSTPLIEQWASDERQSLVSTPGVVEVAAALDEYALFSFVLEIGDRRSPFCGPELASFFEIAEPFDVIGIGFTVIDGRRAVVTSTAFDSDAAASAMVEPTRRAWAGVTVPFGGESESVPESFMLLDVAVDGQVVTAVALAEGETRLGVARSYLFTGDPVAAYC